MRSSCYRVIAARVWESRVFAARLVCASQRNHEPTRRAERDERSGRPLPRRPQLVEPGTRQSACSWPQGDAPCAPCTKPGTSRGRSRFRPSAQDSHGGHEHPACACPGVERAGATRNQLSDDWSRERYVLSSCSRGLKWRDSSARASRLCDDSKTTCFTPLAAAPVFGSSTSGRSNGCGETPPRSPNSGARAGSISGAAYHLSATQPVR